MSKRTSKLLAVLSATVLLAAGLSGVDAAAGPKDPVSNLPPLPARHDAKVTPFETATAKKAADERAQAMRPDTPPKAAVWPAASDEVVTPAAAPGDNAVQLLAPATRNKASAAPSKARLRILDRSKADAVDVPGFLLTVARADGGAGDASAQLIVDYSGFADAYGGDWASRLKIVALPKCALTNPAKPGCSTGAEVGSVNDEEQKTLTAPVTVGGDERVMAVTAGSASSDGDYGATSLSPAASWSAGRSSGDFTWNYPLRVPPAPAGPTPQLSIDYSAQSVDGRTAASNNQSSWVGEGFELSESYVERKYASCNDDGQAGKYDLCWKYDNATLVLNGQAGELVKDGTGWRLKNDDGSRIEKVVNPDDNGDNDREAWKVTTLDGTQYYFGRQHVLPGATSTPTNAVWTVPVAGDDTGEPCHATTFATSFCDNQAWRWNLDYVVDPHGNAMSLWYAKESNYYAKNGATTATKPYDRGGYLTKILYGQRSEAMTATAPMQVLFTTQERCLANCGSLTSATKSSWPDVPFDQICAAGATCTKIVPTFFSRRRLQSVTTQVLKGSAYQGVDEWQLVQDFPSPGDNMSGRALWLDSITHTGKAAASTAATPLTVGFDQVALPNRVDSDADGISSMTKLRVGTIWTETGAKITVNYAAPECVAGVNMPASEDTNTMRCYPVDWQPPLEVERHDWFHRHVVEQVRVNDITGGADAVVTNYTYGGGGAWHLDENPLIPAAKRKWSSWRGFRTVTTSSGDPFQPGPRSRTVTSYFRGMDGDKLKSGDTKSVSVADTLGGSRVDAPALAGLVREAITYAAIDSNTEVSGTLNDYWTQQTAAQTVETGLVRTANLVRPSAVAARITRDAGRTDLVHIARTTYDPDTGLPTSSEDEGDPSKADETCTITSYAKNVTTGLLGLPSRIVTSKNRCDGASANPPANRLLSDVRTMYDGGAFGAVPTKGGVTSTQRATGYTTAGAPIYQTTATTTYDTLGRATAVTDALGRTSTTAYTPAGAGALTQTIATSPPIVPGNPNSTKLATKTTYRPEWGSRSQVVDPNGKITDVDYDVLGRLTGVWLPNQSKAAGKLANTRYIYSLSSTAPSYVRTDDLNINADGYLSSFAIYDSLLRSRQAQEPAAGGGRLISETKYNSRGLAIIQNSDLWDSQAPAGTMAKVLDASVPNETQLTYDGAGRQTVSTFAISAQTQWSTRTLYGGDTVTTLPPNGAPATAEVKDARGQVIERREYDGGTVTPGFIESNYAYDAGGRLTQLTTAGSTWSYGYDLLGRKISSTDPDSGTTTSENDDADRIIAVTNANEKKLINTYDNLDRKVTVHEGSKTDANLRLSWDYDASGNFGQLYQSTRYTSGKTGPAYKSKITGRNVLYQPTATSVVVPASEGPELDGIYETRIGYLPDAETVEFTDVPGGGTLGTEILRYTYNELGQPTSMKSGDAVYANDVKYTALGDPERYELGDSHNMDIVNTFEAGTRRLSTTVAGDVAIVANHHYTYDPTGNLLQDNNLIGADAQCYDYDAHRRLTEAWTPSSANCATSPSVAGLGGAAPYWQSWSYTADGLRKAQTDHAAAGDTVATYTYDTAQPHTVKSIATTGAVPKPTASYGYDDAGNTTSRPDPSGTGQSLTWDAENKLQKLTNSAGDTSYVYDADGNLLLRKSPGKTTLYVGSLELTLDTATKIITSKREYSIDGQAVAVRSSTTDLKWLVPDHHDTTSVAVDSKTLARTTRYTTPFGESRGTDPTGWPDDHGFLGKPLDKTTGLTHVGAREYDPVIGRFLSVDPVMDTSDPQQMLGYTYGNNNPTTMSDPTGLMNCDCDGSHGDAPNRIPPTPTGDTGGNNPTGGSGGGSNSGSTGGDDGSSNGGGGGDNDNSGGGGGIGGFLKKAVHHTAHAVDLGNKAWNDYTAGIGAQAIDTAKGLAVGAYQQGKCMAIHACQSQLDMVSTIIRSPGSVWNAMVEPVKQDWSGGEQTKAAGRVTFMVVETLVGTKGAGRAASAASAPARATAARAGESAGAKATAAAAETAAKACSFSGATTVLMADGTHKPISEVKPGDKVIATDPETGEQAAKTVTRVWVHSDTVIDLVVDGERITTTEDHPFWSTTDRRFERADELAIGEQVLGANGHPISVSGLEFEHPRHGAAYNLSIEGIHTYHVGGHEILVHNTCGPNLGVLSAAGRVPGKNGLTAAGRAYQKHMDRGQLPSVVGKELNSAGHDLLDDILSDPRSDFQSIAQGGFKGGTRVIRNRIINDQFVGAVYDAGGAFKYFGLFS